MQIELDGGEIFRQQVHLQLDKNLTTVEDFELHSDENFESYLLGIGLYTYKKPKREWMSQNRADPSVISKLSICLSYSQICPIGIHEVSCLSFPGVLIPSTHSNLPSNHVFLMSITFEDVG